MPQIAFARVGFLLAAVLWLSTGVVQAQQPKSGRIALDPAGAKVFAAPGKVSAISLTYGDHLAAGTEDGVLAVWTPDAPPNAPQTTRADARKVTVVAFSPDGAWLVTGGEDGRVAVWNAKTLARADTFAATGGAGVTALAFSSDSADIAAGYENGGVKLWSRTQPQPIRTLDAHKKRVLAVGFKYHDDDTLFSVGQDKTMALWQVSTGKRLSRIDLVNDRETGINGLAYKAAAIAGEGNQVAIWGYGFNFRGGMRSGAFAGDSEDQNWIKLLDTGGVESDALNDSSLSTESIRSPLLALSSDGALLASTGQAQKQDTLLHVWSLDNRLQVGSVTVPSAIRCLEFGYGRSGYRVAVADARSVTLYPLTIHSNGVPTQTCVVYDFKGDDPQLAAKATGIVRETTSESRKYILINQKAMIELLSDINKRDILGLKRDDMYARPPEWQFYIDGSVSHTGDQYVLSLSLTDKNGGVVKAVKSSDPFSEDQLPDVARKLTRDLLGVQE